MSVSGYMRVGTSTAYNNTLQNLDTQQVSLSNMQNELSSGLSITTPSDNPSGAEAAERALTRLQTIAAEQSNVSTEQDSMTQAEGTLGEITTAMQSIRTLVVNAGDASQTAADRSTIANQISQLSAQVLSLSNTSNSNGKPVFGGLGSATTPFTEPSTNNNSYTFNGLPGQTSSSNNSIPATLNGEAAFMNQPSTDGVYNVTIDNDSTGTPSPIDNTRTLTTSAVTVSNAAQVNGSAYSVSVTGVDSTTTPGTTTVTYNITENPNVGGPYDGITASFPTDATSPSFAVTGMPGLAMTVNGTPEVGDTFNVAPESSVFSTLADAVSQIGSAVNNNAATQAVGQALNNIDIAMAKISSVRGQAGTLMQDANTIATNLSNNSLQEQTDLSNAQDVNMVSTISAYQSQQTDYQAALQAYSEIQKLSLFNYINGG